VNIACRIAPAFGTVKLRNDVRIRLIGGSAAFPGQRMTASESKRQMESDLESARERLSFYEQFDEIIKQNIASSSALLKEASARFDSDFTEERSKYRALLSDILDDLTALQTQSEKLARRVGDALDELENVLPAPGESAPSAATAAAAAASLNAEAPAEAAAVVNAAPTSRKKADRAKPAAAAAVAVAEEPAVETVPVPAPPVVAMPPTEGAASTTVLVHGVPRASAALGLKSYIEKLDFVTAVEPREFAAGLLRLQVDGTRPLSAGDLSGWSMSDRIELKNDSNGLLELNLTPA
jgi:hypothetical protein